jgi:hypothetical protein
MVGRVVVGNDEKRMRDDGVDKEGERGQVLSKPRGKEKGDKKQSPCRARVVVKIA